MDVQCQSPSVHHSRVEPKFKWEYGRSTCTSKDKEKQGYSVDRQDGLTDGPVEVRDFTCVFVVGLPVAKWSRC